MKRRMERRITDIQISDEGTRAILRHDVASITIDIDVEQQAEITTVVLPDESPVRIARTNAVFLNAGVVGVWLKNVDGRFSRLISLFRN